ncbi:MAG TPA: Asp-tRNA(Asn)/Glu-tRNA(Gln) amidotransferase subunit GatB [Clostridiales bacterium]|nr:Asp-tRNA(Asn)/Glu-tRNA(Gln) amidotransferase subunit GatB [Clostridiales bacterium]
MSEVKYETVIGLEVHTELATASKIFCSCTTEFGGEPNTHCCPICTGMPGVLPVLNQKVVEFGIAVGLATDCEITLYGKFDRKNYFYPDLPKAFQISQLYLPICRNGVVAIEGEGFQKNIRIHEIHMEEDAGKLIHDPIFDTTHADYNRCGVPLLEIVSEPDFRNAEEVIAYLETLKAILQYLGVSDCKMQEGSLRADVNLSVRPLGQAEFGTRTEMKNINSFRAIARAIAAERKRQIELIEDGGRVVQETRRWDDAKGVSYAMRSKEDAQDYRYFPEPDLSPVVISEEWKEEIRKSLPMLPKERKAKYMEGYGLSSYDAGIITGIKALADYFDEVNAILGQPQEVANWLLGDFMRLAKAGEGDSFDILLSPVHLAEIILMVKNNVINRNTAKEVFAAVWQEDLDPRQYVEEHDLAMVGDGDLIKDTVAKVLAANPKTVAEFKAGKEKVLGFLVGQCMKELKGKADPATLNTLLREALQ